MRYLATIAAAIRSTWRKITGEFIYDNRLHRSKEEGSTSKPSRPFAVGQFVRTMRGIDRDSLEGSPSARALTRTRPDTSSAVISALASGLLYLSHPTLAARVSNSRSCHGTKSLAR